jgi:hypothetical protein
MRPTGGLLTGPAEPINITEAKSMPRMIFVEMDFMYARSVEDPDGHIFEPVWMDPSAIEGAAGAEPAHAGGEGS